jgi:mannose-6-phosphate isomerase-like protein (cupin superfamily)
MAQDPAGHRLLPFEATGWRDQTYSPQKEPAMQRIGILVFLALLGFVLAYGSADAQKAPTESASPPAKAEKGAPPASSAAAIHPYVGPIEKITLQNSYFRRVLFTGKHSQLVVMCLQPGEEIGNEMHANVDQFFRFESGKAKFIFGGNAERLVGDGDAVVVPAGTYHNIINMSAEKPLKLYTIYSPPLHPAGAVHKTKAEAEAAEHH